MRSEAAIPKIVRPPPIHDLVLPKCRVAAPEIKEADVIVNIYIVSCVPEALAEKSLTAW